VIESVRDEKVMAPGYNWQLQRPDEPVVVNGEGNGDVTAAAHGLALAVPFLRAFRQGDAPPS
jgi:hypothetical protein